MAEASLELVISAKRALTPDISEFELRDPASKDLPGFLVGAHIGVETPSGAVRSYSLTNDEIETDRYLIAIKREYTGRGASASMHASAKVGDMVRVQAPHNALQLRDAPHYLLIAGGIGITAMLPLFRKLRRTGHPSVRLIYLTKSRQATPFIDELGAPELKEIVTLHYSAAEGSRRMDLRPLLAKPNDTHIYYCGPARLMDAIYLQTIHWPRKQLHFEDFAGVSAVGIGSSPFHVRRAGTGEVFEIPADKTVVEVFRDAGLKPKSSCETGTCGTCKVRLVGGDADHRDLYLSEQERTEFFMPCVSRGTDELVLDI